MLQQTCTEEKFDKGTSLSSESSIRKIGRKLNSSYIDIDTSQRNSQNERHRVTHVCFSRAVVCGDLMRRESGVRPSALALDAPRANDIECPMAMTYSDATAVAWSNGPNHPIWISDMWSVET